MKRSIWLYNADGERCLVDVGTERETVRRAMGYLPLEEREALDAQENLGENEDDDAGAGAGSTPSPATTPKKKPGPKPKAKPAAEGGA
jgi:hypothetical protein